MPALRDIDRLRFGHFEVDLGSGELFRNGRRIALQDLPFQVLTALVTNSGQLLTREELITRFWPKSPTSDDDSLNTAVRKIRRALGDDVKTPRYIETVGRRGYHFVMPVRPAESQQVQRQVSIGVLGIEELTQSTERNFTRGVIEEVIAQLSATRSIFVVALSSRTSLDEIQIERVRLQRRVDYFLACSARLGSAGGTKASAESKRHSHARITVKLIRSADRSVRWAESFDYTAADLLATPTDVAAKIAEGALRSLGFGESSPPTANASAYEAFLKAEYLWKKRTPASLRSALDLYKVAVSKDQQFSNAHIGLAQTHLMLVLHGLARPKVALIEARDLARQLTETDVAKYHPQVVLAWTDMVLERNWAQAEGRFKQAIQSLPDLPYPQSGYAYLLFAQGRREQAMVHIRRALNIEPLSAPLMMLKGVFHLYKGDCLGAEESLQQSLELEPNYELSLAYLGLTHTFLGEFDKALAAARRAVVMNSDFAIPIAFYAFVAGAAGKLEEARDAVALLWSMHRRSYVPAYALAVGYLSLGDAERAMEEIERAEQERSSWILFASSDPLLKALHSDQRFLSLLDHLGLPRP
jgi:DNA-binding winged helix-turn-helix (wHTH) protein/tetratricopeptide (TPR) repeat protein